MATKIQFITQIDAASSRNSSQFRSGPKDLAKAANNSCDPKILDTCATTLMVFGRRGVYLPKNFDEMVPHCQEEFDAEDCIKNYARKCLPPFERQLAGVLIIGAGQVLRKRCSPEGTKEYLSHYKCINDNIEYLHDSMDQLIYTFMETSEMSNDIKIPTSCCAFARFLHVSDKIIKSQCSKYDKTAQHYIGIKTIKAYVNDLLDLSCHGYDNDSSKCVKIKLPTGGFRSTSNDTIERIPNSKLPPNKPSSVIWPFLKVFANL